MGAIERSGATVVEETPELTSLDRTYHVLRAMGYATGFARMPQSVSQHFKKTILDNIEFASTLSIDDIANANLDRTTIFLSMQNLLQNFDVLACPTVGCMPREVEIEWIDEISGKKLSNYMDWLRFSFLATITGLPAISVPVGFAPSGMPVGIQLIGPSRGEAKLLAVARAVELAVGGPLGPIDPKITHM